MKKLLEFGEYTALYKLPVEAVTIEAVEPELDINKPGLLMHGSVIDPYLILKSGLESRETQYFKEFKSLPQICMGLNSTNRSHTLEANGSVKNAAVKYAQYFSKDGMVYLLSDEVKDFITYGEQIDDYGDYQRGNASVTEPIDGDLITGIITKNLPKAMAALLKSRRNLPVYMPDGTEYRMRA